MKKMIAIVTIMLFTINTHAQKVANYSTGTAGQDDYENFSFWIKANKRAEVNYSYGKDRKESTIQFISKTVLNGEKGFKIKFKNNLLLYVIPKDKQLKISSLDGKYLKYFSWEYEGPVNGVGTFCEPCAQDDTEAMGLITRYYMK